MSTVSDVYQRSLQLKNVLGNNVKSLVTYLCYEVFYCYVEFFTCFVPFLRN